jgi:extracellular factor (EF) 3-hydroxypalmitic acid methyl ester biosynthesis protein
MKLQPPVLEGWILSGRKKLSVTARFASRYSVHLELPDGKKMPVVVHLSLNIRDKTVDIGSCRLMEDADESNTYLCLTSDGMPYDFTNLFYKMIADPMDPMPLNLEMILGYKNRIDENFRRFVSDLSYDLSVYAGIFDQLETDYQKEPPQVREIAIQGIINNAGRKLYDYMGAKHKELTQIVNSYKDEEHGHHGYYFRKQLWYYLLRAPIMARTNLKPRGYNGDSEMMRMIYENDYQGSSIFGKILHKYSIDQPAAQAVRNRRNIIAGLVRERSEKAKFHSKEKLRILSVACGPAIEVKDILQTPGDCKRMHFSLLDQDQLALVEASGIVNEIEKNMKTQVSVDLIKESVRTMLLSPELKKRWGQYHFIYSMGLFDYLTAPVAAAVIKKIYQLLYPGGEMVIGNMASGNPNRFFMEYWGDWKIIYRSEEEFLRLVPELAGAKVRINVDQTGIQMLMSITKAVTDE